MFGSAGTATNPAKRHRAAAWLAVLAFGLAQFLFGAHVHASTGSDEPPQALCTACAFADDGQLAALSFGQAVCLLPQPAAKLPVLGIVIKRQAHSFQVRAPPSP